MKRNLRVLICEENPDDLEVLMDHLTDAGYLVESKAVTSPEAFEQELLTGAWQVILCAHQLSSFDARFALKSLRDSDLDIPFIIVSDSIGEEAVVDLMLEGAGNVIPKSSILKLVPAIERELLKAVQRTALKRAEKERRVLFDIIKGAIATEDLDDFLLLVHESISKVMHAENCFVMLHDTDTDLIHFQFWADSLDPRPDPAPLEKGFSSYVLKSGKPLLLNKKEMDDMYASGKAVEVGSECASWLGVPLRTPERVLGVLVVQDYEIEDRFSQSDLDFLVSAGDQIALVIERKWAEMSIRQSEEIIRDLVDNAADAIYSVDLEGNYTSANRSFESLTGFNRKEILSMNIADLHTEESLEKNRQSLRSIVEEGQSKVCEVSIRNRKGEVVNLETTGRLILERDTPKGIQSIARDVTEVRLRQEKQHQSQKMEVVGQLAGGIAHDFNNLLTAINGYCDLSLNKIAQDDPVRQFVAEARIAGERAAVLTNQLLAFSRKQVVVPRTIDVNDLISNLISMLRRILPESIELRTLLDPELENAFADPNQIEQVIMNLAINARDAMPEGGIFTIATRNDRISKAVGLASLKLPPGSFVSISVSDTGEGISPEILDNVFEPFFTTKETGKGTGLGLSTVHGIVKQAGGAVTVYSEVGIGSTFRAYFPTSDVPSLESDRLEEHRLETGGSETILLVEDNDLVRGLVSEILTASGFKVFESADGPSALQMMDSIEDGVDLLLTDVVMPSMNGKQLADEAKAKHPGLRVLFMSGYADDSVFNTGILDIGSAFIEKPFTPEVLTARVRELLDEPRDPALSRKVETDPARQVILSDG